MSNENPKLIEKNWWMTLLCNLFFSLTILYFFPMEVILNNLNEFLLPFNILWWLQLLIAVGSGLLLSVLMLLLSYKIRQVLTSVILGMGVAFWIQSLFMNGRMISLTGDSIQITQSAQIFNMLIWLAIISAISIICIIWLRKRQKETQIAMCFIAGALILIQLTGFLSFAFTIDTSDRNVNRYLSQEDEFTLGNDKNVIVFVLDTVDEVYFNQMIEKYPEMRDKLSGWIYYGNSTSVYSRTYPSIPYLLTGEKCYFDKKPEFYIDEAYRSSTFLPKLYEHGIDIRIFTEEPSLVGSSSQNTVSNYVEYNYDQIKNLDVFNLEKNIVSISLFKGFPYVFKETVAFDIREINTSSFIYSKDAKRFNHTREPDFYNELIKQKIDVSEEYSKAFRFYHLWGTHPGFFWNEKLELSDENEDVAVALRGSFLAIESYISMMKEKDIYDSSTIIITADHGYSGGNTDKLDVPTAACPLILVKYPNCNTDEAMFTSMAPVSHEDLFATIEMALNSEISGCGSGTTLQSHDADEIRPRYYYYSALYSDKDGEVALKEYEIIGNAYFIENWKATGKWWDINYSMNKVSTNRYTED